MSRLLDVSTRRAGGALRPEKLQGSKGHIQQSRWDPGRARLFGTTLLFSSDQPGRGGRSKTAAQAAAGGVATILH